MFRKTLKGITLCLLAAITLVSPTFALKDMRLDQWAANNIMFYDPDEKQCGNQETTNSSEDSNSSTDSSETYARLKEAIDTYYPVAMSMQEEWGTPWDVIFAQMQIESQVGTAGVAVSGATNNWLGITGSGDAGSYKTSNHTWAVYSDVSKSIEDWAGTRVLRNGYYDDAFPFLNTSNWDMHSFLTKMISHYAPESDGNDESNYVSLIEDLLNGPIKDETEKLGLETSQEYAVSKNIPVGGKHPLGSTDTQTTSDTETVTSLDCPEDTITIDGKVIAEKASEMAWPNQSDGTCVNSQGNSVSWETNKTECYPNPRDAYKENFEKYSIGGSMLDCGHFVATVVHAAGVDNDFPKGGSDNMGTHMSSSSKWETVSSVSSESDLKEGDIMWYNGHIEIYVGSYGGSYGKIASASLDDYVGIIKAFRMKRKNQNAVVYRLIPQTSGLKDGGMTKEEADAFMESYAAESDKFKTGDYEFDGALVTDAGCPNGTLNNCSAFTQWFLNKYTSLGPSGANRYQGSQAVQKYLADSSDLEDGGKVPKVYAVFSSGPFTGSDGTWANHTGIVLGINKEADEIYIGEASCGMNSGKRRFRPQAGVYSLSKYTNAPESTGPTYAYTDKILVGLTSSDTGATTSGEGTQPIGPLTDNSDSVACASGTTDLGIDTEAYTQGIQKTIRLCSIPNITSSSSEDSDGHIHVNSRVSGAYYALGQKYSELYGGTLSASSSYRTYAKQEELYGCYQSKQCNNGYLAAKPGYSNHQLGTAVDFDMGGSGWGNSGVSGFFNQYLANYGLNRGVSGEPWHVSPSN